MGFLPTQSYCGRIRGDALNLTAELCGNRLSVIGATRWGDLRPGPARIERLTGGLEKLRRDVTHAVELMFNTPSVLARFEGVGVVSRDQALDLGLVGVAARASGLDRDVRRHHPYGLYTLAQMPVSIVLRAIVTPVPWSAGWRSNVLCVFFWTNWPPSWR